MRKALSYPFSIPCLSMKEPAGSYIVVRSRKLKKLHGGIKFPYLKCERFSFILINFNFILHDVGALIEAVKVKALICMYVVSKRAHAVTFHFMNDDNIMSF